MNIENKKRIAKGIKVFALAVYGLLTIATCAAVWNYCPETAVKWFAGALFVFNCISIYLHAKNIKTE